jgi:uncharacterized protein YodC (DUF2158 family)
MITFRSGDLVVLKSGGPTMTVDTVNTDIFDDDQMTGVLCVWFVGDKLERVRFDHRAIEPAPLEKVSPPTSEAPSQEVGGEYLTVLGEMVDAMNVPAEAASPARKKPKPARPAKGDSASASTVIAGAGSSTIG